MPGIVCFSEVFSVLFFDYGRVNGYGGGQIWYGLKAYPSGRRLPKTRSPTDKNLANGLSLSKHRENPWHAQSIFVLV
jgi:hypothetical protein